MPDNDSLIYRQQKKLESNAAERNLITLERSQKLDLLIHLLANLRKVLVVCGPNGIGKTTLLQALYSSRKDLWDIYRLKGTSNLNYETIVNELNHFFNHSDTAHGFDVAALRNHCAHRKVILIIDDAGQLAPGLIDSLVSLSESLAGLRLVFAMTYDEFHIKVVTDKALEDSHSIELPALTLKQCSEFLQNLSAQPGALLPFKAVTDSLVADLYRETHGIPGRMLAEIPKLNQYPLKSKSRIGLWMGVTAIVLIAGWFINTLLPPVNEPSNKNLPQMAQQKTFEPIPLPKANAPDSSAVDQPAPSQSTVLPIKSVEDKPGVAMPPAVPTSPAASQPTAAKAIESSEPVLANPLSSIAVPPPPSIKVVEQPVAKPEVKPVISPTPALPDPVPPLKKSAELKTETSVAADDNLEWIMAQPAENYTLQVMVLSSKSAAQRFLKKYPKYSDNLKYYVISKYAQEKFVLIYGSFSSSAEARLSKTELPAEFNHSLEKKFKLIQNESRR